jgi:cytochrome c5
MHPVLTRFFRPRLLLPLVMGVLVAPAYLVSSAESPAAAPAHAESVCTNVAKPVENPRKDSSTNEHAKPTCANCRAPLLNAPLARADQDARPSSELPPAA